MNKPTSLKHIPKGFSTYVTSCGIKNNTLDLGIVYSTVVANAAALFTKNKIKGNPLKVGAKHIKNGKLQALVVNSKNSNVATGIEGYKHCVQVCEKVANELEIKKEDVFPSSTGVIKVLLPVDKILKSLDQLKEKLITPPNFENFAEAIMTTDTHAKYISKKCGEAVIVCVAKGAGMIEPNMATMLAYFFTDAKISSKTLKKILKKVVSKTFNSLSIDGDTSTSDTVAIMANGLAGKVDLSLFEQTLFELALEATRWIARDGEGATKLFIVTIDHAKNQKEAYKMSKSVINSPLVKTAIYQGDPNWGRLYMAIGKTNSKIKEEKIRLFWGKEKIEFLMNETDKLSKYLQENEEIILTIDLGIGKGSWTSYGCDLTEEYVKINAFYTT